MFALVPPYTGLGLRNERAAPGFGAGMRVIRTCILSAVWITLALLLTLHIPLLRDHFKFLLFWCAVLASATQGTWPGVFGTFFGVLAADYFLVPPPHSYVLSNPEELFRALLFCAAGLAITWAVQRVKIAEDGLRAAASVIENSADSILRQDVTGRILSWNKAAEETFGYSAKEAIGQPASILVPSDRKDELRQLAASVQHGVAVKNYETVLRRKDGTRVDVALTLSPVRDREGRPVGISSIARDITAGKLAEDARRQSNERLEYQTHQLRLLAEMGELLQASSTPADAYAVIGRFSQGLIPACSGDLFEYSASRDKLEVVMQWGGAERERQTFMAPDECWALQRGHVHLVEDFDTSLLCRHLGQPRPSSYVCAPIIGHDETLGLLHLRLERQNQGSVELKSPGPTDLTWVARTMAERLALTLSDMKLRAALRIQSIRDPLTGWFNRRFMEETLEREISRAARNRRSLAVLMMDIDKFKDFNDSYGHEAGDVALQSICQLIKRHVRSEDAACRYGGDEFVLILPDTTPELAGKRAEEIRISLGGTELHYQRGKAGALTVSLGIATFPANGNTAPELLRAADAALFRAKRTGRDRVQLQGQA